MQAQNLPLSARVELMPASAMLVALRNNRPARQQSLWPLSIFVALLLVFVHSPAAAAEVAGTSPAPIGPPANFEFIDTSFENASPLWYDFDPDGTIKLHLLYDNERSSVNRAAGHFHF